MNTKKLPIISCIGASAGFLAGAFLNQIYPFNISGEFYFAPTDIVFLTEISVLAAFVVELYHQRQVIMFLKKMVSCSLRKWIMWGSLLASVSIAVVPQVSIQTLVALGVINGSACHVYDDYSRTCVTVLPFGVGVGVHGFLLVVVVTGLLGAAIAASLYAAFSKDSVRPKDF